MSTHFLGLDLAWSARNTTGAVALRQAGPPGRSRANLDASPTSALLSDDEIVEWVQQQMDAAPPDTRTLIGIDAPLIAPNPPGTGRPADRQVTRLYGRFHAGCYPANRERCARPIALARRLVEHGFSLDPSDVAAGHPRVALEVYPHAATVGLFGLARIPKYKKGRVAARRTGLAGFQDLLQQRLPTLDPPILPPPPEDVAPLRGKSLKALEDRLDSLMCAAMVAVYERYPERCVIAGDVEEGYILVPEVPVLDEESPGH